MTGLASRVNRSIVETMRQQIAGRRDPRHISDGEPVRTGEEMGPVRVPERAVEIARVGWSLSAASFGRGAEGWHILEMGNVYP